MVVERSVSLMSVGPPASGIWMTKVGESCWATFVASGCPPSLAEGELLHALANIDPHAAASMAPVLKPTHQPSLASRFAADSAAMVIEGNTGWD